MAGQMLLRLPVSLADDTFEWALVDARGNLQGEPQRGDAAAAAAAARGRALTVAVSGVDAQLTSARVPGRNRNRARAAIPFALEEGLVEDVGAYHFVAGRPDAESVYPVLVVLRSFMDDLLARLDSAGLQPVRVVSEAQLLGAERGWSVLLGEDGRAVARLGPTRGFSAESDALLLLLQAARAELATDDGWVVPLRLYGAALPEVPQGFSVEHEPAVAPLEVLARGLASAPLNLLQGEYGRHTQVTRVVRAYRPAVVLAAALVLLLGVAGVVEYRALQLENQRLRDDIEAVFRQAFPEVRRVVNPRAQMEQRLRALQGDARPRSGFLELLGAAAEPVASLPNVQLQALTYRRGRLELDLEAQRLQSLDALQRDIASRRGISASLESAKSDQERVRGRLRIVGADAS